MLFLKQLSLKYVILLRNMTRFILICCGLRSQKNLTRKLVLGIKFETFKNLGLCDTNLLLIKIFSLQRMAIIKELYEKKTGCTCVRVYRYTRIANICDFSTECFCTLDSILVV